MTRFLGVISTPRFPNLRIKKPLPKNFKLFYQKLGVILAERRN